MGSVQTRVFRQLNPMQTPRVYHSTGILLSDGRVYSGGGGQCGATPLGKSFRYRDSDPTLFTESGWFSRCEADDHFGIFNSNSGRHYFCQYRCSRGFVCADAALIGDAYGE